MRRLRCFCEHLLELAAVVHLAGDVGAAQELAVRVQLRDRGPLRTEKWVARECEQATRMSKPLAQRMERMH